MNKKIRYMMIGIGTLGVVGCIMSARMNKVPSTVLNSKADVARRDSIGFMKPVISDSMEVEDLYEGVEDIKVIPLTEISLDELTKRLNSIYYKEHEKIFLKNKEVWEKYSFQKDAKTGLEFQEYIFREDEKMYLDPDILVGLSKEDKLAYITISQSYERFTDYTNNLFISYFASVTQSLFPTLNPEEVNVLYLNLTNDEQFIEENETPYPNKIYYLDGIGCYSYFKTGGIKIHFEPIGEEQLKVYKQRGVECLCLSKLKR